MRSIRGDDELPPEYGPPRAFKVKVTTIVLCVLVLALIGVGVIINKLVLLLP